MAIEDRVIERHAEWFETGKGGLWRLGMRGALLGSGEAVIVPFGAVHYEGQLVVRYWSTAHSARSIYDAAEDACTWNQRIARMRDGLLRPEDAAEAIERAFAWMKEPLDAGGWFSHHGIHSDFCVAVCGRPIPLSLAPRGGGVLVLAYEGPEPDEDWNLPRYDAQRVVELVTDAVGARVTDQWNAGRSTIVRWDVHSSVREAFAGGGLAGQGPRGVAPEGWW